MSKAAKGTKGNYGQLSTANLRAEWGVPRRSYSELRTIERRKH